MRNSKKHISNDTLGYIYYFIKREEKCSFMMIEKYMKRRFNITKQEVLEAVELLQESAFLMSEEVLCGDGYNSSYTVEMYYVTSRPVPYFLQPYDEVPCEE